MMPCRACSGRSPPGNAASNVVSAPSRLEAQRRWPWPPTTSRYAPPRARSATPRDDRNTAAREGLHCGEVIAPPDLRDTAVLIGHIGDRCTPGRIGYGAGLCIGIGDVVGHGLAAADVMGRLRSVLRAYALLGRDPAEVLHS
jgi:hypothetical protein